jgi:hypothetical protein
LSKAKSSTKLSKKGKGGKKKKAKSKKLEKIVLINAEEIKDKLQLKTIKETILRVYPDDKKTHKEKRELSIFW